MKLLVVSSAPVIRKDGSLYAYSPYVEELAIWARHATEITICCPVWKSEGNLLVKPLDFDNLRHQPLPEISVVSVGKAFRSFFSSFAIFVVLYRAMAKADHIHLRCPGNIGLLGCIVQLLFPFKRKTAKYAGNWDPKANQPFSYRVQKYILKNTSLTRRMTVLVYGKWPPMSSNLKSFFTASYGESEKTPIITRNVSDSQVGLLFAGMLTKGKNPLYALKIAEGLSKRGCKVLLSIYGDGGERLTLQSYICENGLDAIAVLHGNVSKEVLKHAYQQNHLVILPSESEGWPKAIAEGMFWGCVPVSSSVSCLPYMLDYGKRGILLDLDLNADTEKIIEIVRSEDRFTDARNKAVAWARGFTMETFELEISKLIRK